MDLVGSTKRNLTTSAYAQFSGRASRSEYWWFALASVLIIITAAIVDAASSGSVLFTGIAYLGLIIPTLALSVRRLHDTNHTGLYWLLNLVPFVGSIVLFIFLVTAGDKKANDYGPASK